MVQVVAEAALLDGVPAGDDVEQEPAPGDPLVGRRHLRGQDRREDPRPERDQELQPFGVLRQRDRGQPRVLAPGAGGRQDGLDAQPAGRPGDLRQVVDVRGAHPGDRRDA
ncbi:hypothetical protein OIF68_06235 [Actinacidiphila glaucinigra]|nr:hypothetical protein [Actinacidiphila glaucinigra]